LFGVVRLKIIDLSDASNQPFIDKENKVALIYDGEIYNFKELKINIINGGFKNLSSIKKQKLIL